MCRPVQNARVGGGVNRGRVVTRLQDIGQPLGAQAFELGAGKRRSERDVGHDRQRVAKTRDGDVQPHGRRVAAACHVEIGSEKIDRIRDLERRSSSGAFFEHRGRQAPHAELARRVVARAAKDHEIDLRDRHLVALDDPHREAVRELLLLDRRESEGGWRARLGWTRAVRRLLGDKRRCAEDQRCC